MPPAPAARPASDNHLLAALSQPAYQRMLRHLHPVQLVYGQVLYKPMGEIHDVYFPLDSLVSLLTAVDVDRSLEVGMVGNEGMVGMPMALGVGVSDVRTLVQGTGTALRMSAARFRIEFKTNARLQKALFRYNHLLMAQISQTAACNRFHNATQRLARWLLMTADRVHSEAFLRTHEFLAHMLGMRRVGITQAAGVLQQAKLITYHRGNIVILDHTGLEGTACSCYRIIKDLQAVAQAR